MSGSAIILHLRLSEWALEALKHRAAALGIPPADYAEMIIRYASLEREAGAHGPLPEGSSTDVLYFSAPLSVALRERLAAWSDRRHANLAAFAGAVVERFLATHERDPGELNMFCELSVRLEQKPTLTDADLEAVARLGLAGAAGRMPTAYQARWLQSRLQPVVSRFECGGVACELTAERCTEFVARVQGAGPGPC